ncbi:hypothetical protein BAUCODRAFT_32482 [Baudoinia panamericana UAMH 10762]|uniref:FAS1 domain-containing protein n=1 Tax=Baudoinia panamericana (strain UAMH 10762) TaxID=717646 RepID=M2MP12_BAUPA|nr:uncharacterized protein BAUCODRAFT_32482 [Baudoinia panamericana UAMH 10762]EMC98441.1 hypothetical protein BAUCODRAFT_32482 [Baudoinia panamericana UAMH 10762]
MQLKHIVPAALAVAAVSAQNATNVTSNGTLSSLIASNQNLSGLNTLLTAYPSIAQSLANATNVTLFAPSNQAIQALTSGLGALSTADTNALVSALLSYHVVPGRIYASNISSTPSFPHTNLTNPMFSNVTGGQVVEARLQGTSAQIISGMKMTSNVTQANLNFTGGVVHVISSVLSLPSNYETTAQTANLTALLGATNALNLTSMLNNAHGLTIFAPSNNAFQSIGSVVGNLTTAQASMILGYHVVNGTAAYSSNLRNGSTLPTLAGRNLTVTISNGTVFVGGSRIVNPDILLSGGVMHIIDSVLNPNSTARANATATGAATQFSGASSNSGVPYTSGVPSPTTTIAALLTSTTNVASGYTTPSTGAVGVTSASARASSSSSAAANALQTAGAMGAAALFGGAAFFANL